jgi:hypothetical protein
MASQADPKIRTLIIRCRNNGILEYWNDDILLKTHYSSIPAFQVYKSTFVRKAISYDTSCPPGNGFWTDVRPEHIGIKSRFRGRGIFFTTR